MQNNQTKQPELVTALTKYLNCPCRYFPPMEDDEPVRKAYFEAQERGRKEGFTPMLVTVDETMWECFIFNSDEGNNEPDLYSFNLEQVEQYRKETLAQEIESGKKMLQDRMSEYGEGAGEFDMEWDEDFMEEMEDMEDAANNCFMGYQDYSSRNTQPLILAEIPVKNPWEVFAYLPFGGWNECPDTPELMAVTKYWFELYGAVPAVMTHDVLEFALPAPVDQDAAPQLASEQYAFCPDIVDQGMGSVGMLTRMLSNSSVWYFWWD